MTIMAQEAAKGEEFREKREIMPRDTSAASKRARPSPSRRRANVASTIEISALTLALAKGIENITVDEVAIAAGISRRTFYRYFPTIDHALCAMPKRSLNRLYDNLLVRPRSENIFKALVEVARMASTSDEQSEIQSLAHQVAVRWPEAWWRATNNAGVYNAQGMEQVVSARLVLTGEDRSRADLVTALILGVIGVIGRGHSDRGEFGLDAVELEDALRYLTKFVRASFDD